MYAHKHVSSTPPPPDARRSTVRAFDLAALVPPEGHAIYGFFGAVIGPPMLQTVNKERAEPLTLVAAFECSNRTLLENQQVWIHAAEYNEQQRLMLYCLLSPKNAATLFKLAELHFLAVPSLGARIITNEKPQPSTRYPLWAFYVPDTPLTRARLRAWYAEHPSEDGSKLLQ